MTNSPNCTSCQQVESVSHQLFECQNAQSLWGMYNSITGKTVNNFVDIITCNEEIDIEIIKSIIIKRLIQIDRSVGYSIEALKQEVRHYYRI